MSPERAVQAPEDGELLFGTVDTWLIWRLTNGEVHVTDHSNASRTMLMNMRPAIGTTICFALSMCRGPCCRESFRRAGSSGVTAAEHFGREIPIAGIAGDQQAALAGQACFRPGLSKNTYGTGVLR